MSILGCRDPFQTTTVDHPIFMHVPLQGSEVKQLALKAGMLASRNAGQRTWSSSLESSQLSVPSLELLSS